MKVPRLHYCTTFYPDEGCPVDISPLLYQLYRGQRLLVMCAREGMVKRLLSLTPDQTHGCQLRALGWWDLDPEDYGKLLTSLMDYAAVIIVGRDRIADEYLKLAQHFEGLFTAATAEVPVRQTRRLLNLN